MDAPSPPQPCETTTVVLIVVVVIVTKKMLSNISAVTRFRATKPHLPYEITVLPAT